jgi:hypothetical protein
MLYLIFILILSLNIPKNFETGVIINLHLFKSDEGLLKKLNIFHKF